MDAGGILSTPDQEFSSRAAGVGRCERRGAPRDDTLIVVTSELIGGLVLIALVAVLAPLISRGVARWARVPVLVFELVLGIVIGPAALGWVQPGEVLNVLADFGLAMLFFMAGSEIDFAGIKGRPLRRASLGWLIGIAAGAAIGLLIAPGDAAIIIAICLSSTALGTLLPILRDAGELRTPFGRSVSAIGAVGEFGPLIAISVFLSARQPGASTLVLLGFVAVTGALIIYALRSEHGRLHRFVRATLHTSTQFAVRVVVLILVALAVLSIALDLDMLLGAFAAGVIWSLLMRDAPEHDREVVETKVEGIAFGFLVPIFFIYTGVTFDVAALFTDWRITVLVPVFLVLLLITRGLPALLVAPPGSSTRDKVSRGLLAATGLPVIVAATSTGLDLGFIEPGLAAALVGAGMLSVLVYPLVAMAVRGESERGAAVRFTSDE